MASGFDMEMNTFGEDIPDESAGGEENEEDSFITPEEEEGSVQINDNKDELGGEDWEKRFIRERIRSLTNKLYEEMGGEGDPPEINENLFERRDGHLYYIGLGDENIGPLTRKDGKLKSSGL